MVAAMPLKIATWNVNGLRARHARLCSWVAEERPDVLCLQEIKATRDQIPDPLTTLADYWNYWHGGPKGYSGVSLHVRREFASAPPAFGHPAFDSEYRVVEALVDGVRFVSIYVPNGGKDYTAKMAFLAELSAWAAARQTAGERLVIAGDLNVALTDADVHPTEIRAGMIAQRADERALLRETIGHGLVDVLREHHRDRNDVFTWWAPWRNMREKNVGWRIDFVLASASLAHAGTTCVIRKDVLGSDHAPVVVEITLP
jgi:exodeoxyribonuclease-3